MSSVLVPEKACPKAFRIQVPSPSVLVEILIHRYVMSLRFQQQPLVNPFHSGVWKRRPQIDMLPACAPIAVVFGGVEEGEPRLR